MRAKPDNEKATLHSQSAHFRALVNREGRMNVHGKQGRQNPFTDLYHYFFSLTWPKFFIHIGVIYFLINLLFGILYFISGVDALGDGHATGLERLRHCIFLSIESLSAIDFGRIQSSGTMASYMLMSLQAFLGILTIAVITGLFYARFSRATARVIFSNKVIKGKHNGKMCLSFRIANERLNQIAEAHMSLHLTKNEISHEGERSRKFYDLKLEREHTPLFALSWTVRHYIDEKSPLFGIDEAKMKETQMGILASLSGIDESFAQPIIARHAYSVEDIVYNRHFKDIMIFQGKKVHIDLKGIHDLKE